MSHIHTSCLLTLSTPPSTEGNMTHGCTLDIVHVGVVATDFLLRKRFYQLSTSVTSIGFSHFRYDSQCDQDFLLCGCKQILSITQLSCGMNLRHYWSIRVILIYIRAIYYMHMCIIIMQPAWVYSLHGDIYRIFERDRNKFTRTQVIISERIIIYVYKWSHYTHATPHIVHTRPYLRTNETSYV